MFFFFRISFVSIFSFLNIASLVYIDPLGSMRSTLPQNIIGWLSIIMLISLISFFVFYKKYALTISLPAIYYVIALVILAIPLIYQKEGGISFWYWVGIAIGVLLYITGLQLKYEYKIHLFCVYCYISTSCMQSLITLYQYFFEPSIFYFPSGTCYYGLYQQISVLSTGFMSAIFVTITVLILSQFTILNNTHEKFRVAVLNAAIFTFTLTIILIKSIDSWFIFALLSFVFVCFFYKKNTIRVTCIYLIVSMAILIGVFLITLEVQSMENEVINKLHLKQMLRASIALFLDEVYENRIPLHLYNVFSIQFLEYKNSVISSAHNEILLWLMTGGVVNLISMSLLLTGGVYVTYQAIIKYKRNGDGYPLALILSVSPIIIQNIMEFHYFLSAFNWAIVILFLSHSDSSFPLKEQRFHHVNNELSLLILFFLSSLGLLSFTLGALLINDFNLS